MATVTTSLPVCDLGNFRPMDFCWHECTSQILNGLGLNPGLCRKKPAANSMIHGTAFWEQWLVIVERWHELNVNTADTVVPLYMITKHVKLQATHSPHEIFHTEVIGPGRFIQAHRLEGVTLRDCTHWQLRFIKNLLLYLTTPLVSKTIQHWAYMNEIPVWSIWRKNTRREKLNCSDGVIPSNINPRMTCNLTRASLARNTTSRLSYGRTFRQNLIRKNYRECWKKSTDSVNFKKSITYSRITSTKSPSFSTKPSARVSQTLRSSYLNHVIEAAM